MTREEIIIKIPSKHAINIARSIDKLERKYKAEFKKKFKTITFDNGVEFRDYKAIEKSYDKRKKEPRVQVYYAHPYRSGERGSNENANRLIRRFITERDSNNEYFRGIYSRNRRLDKQFVEANVWL